MKFEKYNFLFSMSRERAAAAGRDFYSAIPRGSIECFTFWHVPRATNDTLGPWLPLVANFLLPCLPN